MAGWRSRGGLHPAMSPTPSWSTSELLNPPEGTVESAPIDEEKLRKVARQANIALPDDDAADEEDEDDDHPTLAAVESPAEGALRGVNEVLRFVQALDKVDVEGVEPMWTVLDDEHAAPLRADEVAGARGPRRASPNPSPSPTETWVLDGTRAEEGERRVGGVGQGRAREPRAGLEPRALLRRRRDDGRDRRRVTPNST